MFPLRAWSVAALLLSSSAALGQILAPNTQTFVEKKIRTMTLQEKIGQLLFVGIRGLEITPQTEALIKDLKPGGVILFGHNIRDIVQVSKFTNQLQTIARKNALPLFIAVDQEGGKVARIRRNATVFPGAMALGAAQSRELAYLAGQYTGQELSLLGINMNLAPVLDVERSKALSVIGVRSFGENPHLVSELGQYFIMGLEGENVLSTAKHFPGHGEVSEDSHFTTPESHISEGELLSVDLIPYRKTLSTYPPSAIMTAHVRFPAIDPSGVPATLSKVIISDILRNRLRFHGLVMTDDLEMRGLSNVKNPGSAAVMALEAGADLLMIVWSDASKKQVAKSVLAAIQAGSLSPERIDQSLRRILSAKYEHKLFEPKPTHTALELVKKLGSPQHQALARTIARRALTLVKNENGAIPLSPHDRKRILVLSPYQALASEMAEHHKKLRYVRTTFNPGNEESNQILNLIKKTQPESIVVGMTSQGHSLLVEKLDRLVHPKTIRAPAQNAYSAKLIAVSFDTPYLVDHLSQVDALLVTYSYQAPSPELAAHVILGIEKAGGSLPTHSPPLEDGNGHNF